MIRCIRMWTGKDGNSRFEEGTLEMNEGARGDFIGAGIAANKLYFRETNAGGAYNWHQDPVPRFVITLSGTLEFKVFSGETFILNPGDVLLAQDNTGTGHQWRLLDEKPWIRAYIDYENCVTNGLTFVAKVNDESDSSD